MNTLVSLGIAIKGITKEIHSRQESLRRLKVWYENPTDNPWGYDYSMKFMYHRGPILMAELKKLRLIRAELKFIYDLEYEKNRI